MAEEARWVYVCMDTVDFLERPQVLHRSRLVHLGFSSMDVTVSGDLGVGVVVDHVPGCSLLYFSQ